MRLATVGLSRSFLTQTGSVRALHEISVAFEARALTVISGPSGCGKSTLLSLVGLLDRPSKGYVDADGVSVSDLDPARASAWRREHVGYLFQDGGLIDRMTVADNLATPLMYRGVPRRTRGQRIVDSLMRVGLAQRAKSLVSELSGGERQRVGLARALIADPEIVLCDEPTASLDGQTSQEMTALLKGLAGRRTVICSSHDPILMNAADARMRLDRGELVEAATTGLNHAAL